MALNLSLQPTRSPTRPATRTSAARRVAAWMVSLMRAYRQRRALASMSDSLLKDVGLSRGDVEHAIGEPFRQPIDYRTLEEISRLRRDRSPW